MKNPHSVSPYKKYSVSFQAVQDDDCTVTVSGVEALCSESAERQAAQIFKHLTQFKVIAIYADPVDTQ